MPVDRSVIAWPAATCCSDGDCVCPPEERALRGWKRGDDMPAMNEAQREWCLSEIGQVEGYRRQEFESASDRDLAAGVLSAWTDCCRDKGLL